MKRNKGWPLAASGNTNKVQYHHQTTAAMRPPKTDWKLSAADTKCRLRHDDQGQAPTRQDP